MPYLLDTNSIIVRLLRRSFSLYLLVAVIVTLVHLIIEYNHVENQITKEIKRVHDTFEPILSEALWGLNEEHIRLVLVSMLKTPIVTGVRVVEEESPEITMGIVLNQNNEPLEINQKGEVLSKSKSLAEKPFGLDFLIHTRRGKYLGKVTIYSSSSVVISRIEHSFTLILINAVIKSLALWGIFLGFSYLLVQRPLKQLNTSVENFNLDIEDSDEDQVLHEEKLIKPKDEISTLTHNLEKLRSVMLEKMETIEKQNFALLSYTGKIDSELTFTIEEKERKHIITLNQISHIVIEEHYFNLYYTKDNQWLSWSSYGNLKDIEEQYPGFFFRANRSCLINPNMIKNANLAKEPYTVKMKGNQNDQLTISRSKRKFLAQLYIPKN
jgi:DNA-binding LytR/AlgR family response regulator